MPPNEQLFIALLLLLLSLLFFCLILKIKKMIFAIMHHSRRALALLYRKSVHDLHFTLVKYIQTNINDRYKSSALDSNRNVKHLHLK